MKTILGLSHHVVSQFVNTVQPSNYQIAQLQNYPNSVPSLSPAPDLEVETDNSVLVAQRHNGDRSRDVVLELDDLLVRNRDVGAIGQGKIARHLLLDRELRSANHGGFTGESLRIDLDAAGAEQFLQPAVDGAVERLIDEQVGGVSSKAEGGAGGRRGRRLFLRAAQR